MSTDTRSSQAQRVSRTALDTERQGRLLHAARAHPSPGHAVQLAGQPSATTAQISAWSISAGNEAQARVRQLGGGRTPRRPSSPVGPPPRATSFGARGRSVARPRSLGLAAAAHPQLPATWHDQTASSPSVASRPRRPSSPLRGLPGASAACRPAPQSPARPAPCRPSPAWRTRTSAWSTNPRTTHPNGGAAAQLRPPADAPDR